MLAARDRRDCADSVIGVPDIPPEDGDFRNFGHLSYLPGQRLSACTCPNDPDHPGPRRENGSFVGRGAPEIDMFEAAVRPVKPLLSTKSNGFS